MEYIGDIDQLLKANQGDIAFHVIVDYNELLQLDCDVPSMNRVIHGANFRSIIEYYNCIPCVVRDNSGRIIAFFALREDEVRLDRDESYPALEIAYLAVQNNMQRQGIGKRCIQKIIYLAKNAQVAYRFLTVDALSITTPRNERYEAVSFYRKCHFSQVEMQAPDKDTVRMIFPLS